MSKVRAPMKVTLRPHTPRCHMLKGFVTCTLVATFVVHPSWGAPLAAVGNMIWLWFDFE